MRALVTGAEGDLGQAVAESLRVAGVEVLAPGRIQLDVTSADSVKSFISEAGELELLVCNAGVLADRTLSKMSEQDWDHVLDVNLKGAFLCAREVARGMVKRRSGHIIFVSSFSALHPPIGQVNYSSAKSALLGMMKSMAQELGGRNVRVNAVVPGFMETRMTSGLSSDVKAAILGRHVLGRFNTTGEAAGFITHMHLHMPHTSGQVFNLDSRIV
ncbi:MAG: SDR family NAD(P)-dependent oxidoreductase [Akkermansiaceae bacterium]